MRRLYVRPSVNIYANCFFSQIVGSPPNLHTMVPRFICTQNVLKVKVEVKGHMIRAFSWFYKTCFFQANGWIMTKLIPSLISPFLALFPFLLHPNPQMAASLRCEFCYSSHHEAVCQTVCYTVWSYVLFLRARSLWSTITLFLDLVSGS